MDTRSSILSTAQSVRRWAERRARIDRLYDQCAICSGMIFNALTKKRMRPTFLAIYLHGAHCFVKCQRYTIDVTATQFDPTNPKVVVRKSVPDGRWYWNTDKVDEVIECTSLSAIRKVLRMWPTPQNPFKLGYLD